MELGRSMSILESLNKHTSPNILKSIQALFEIYIIKK